MKTNKSGWLELQVETDIQERRHMVLLSTFELNDEMLNDFQRFIIKRTGVNYNVEELNPSDMIYSNSTPQKVLVTDLLVDYMYAEQDDDWWYQDITDETVIHQYLDEIEIKSITYKKTEPNPMVQELLDF